MPPHQYARHITFHTVKMYKQVKGTTEVTGFRRLLANLYAYYNINCHFPLYFHSRKIPCHISLIYIYLELIAKGYF